MTHKSIIPLALLAFVSCSSEEPNNPLIPEEVYSITNTKLNKEVAGKLWEGDINSVRCFDADDNELVLEECFPIYGGSPLPGYIYIEGDHLTTYDYDNIYGPTLGHLRFWKYDMHFIDKHGMILICSGNNNWSPYMRIESLNEDSMRISWFFNQLSVPGESGDYAPAPGSRVELEMHPVPKNDKVYSELSTALEWSEVFIH